MDLKAALDLSQKSPADILHLVKDFVAMGNLPSGGHIVVRVDDAGASTHQQVLLYRP
ncbi:hypothetical protein AB0P21_00025 [Kribbella sp. NPDC056861]|uniref:hypothetical protein n=1 Tax=Kribbella sp. NPDC056861 TaxID=3154857 RepID=UPI00344697A6